MAQVAQSICEVRRGNFLFYLIIKSYFSYFCCKAIIATISRPNVNIQVNASKVTMLPPPQARQVRLYAVMRCAKQRDYSLIHILPRYSLSVYILFPLYCICCKFTPSFLRMMGKNKTGWVSHPVYLSLFIIVYTSSFISPSLMRPFLRMTSDTAKAMIAGSTKCIRMI